MALAHEGGVVSSTVSHVVEQAIADFPTPFYLFDEVPLKQTIARLRAAMPANASLCYAMKANPFITGMAEPLVARVEVCSPGEMRICQALGIPAHKIVVSGVHKDPALMRELIAGDDALGRYTVESVGQYDLLEQSAANLGKRIPIIIRLTSGNQFGVDKSCVRELVSRALASPTLEFCGIQYFSGTQKSSPKKLARELKRLDTLLAELAATHGDAVRDMELEYGAGLPAEYFEQDETVARAKEDELVEGLATALGAMEFRGPIIIELGRAIAASCGTYVTQVMDTKCNKGNNYAIVDGGMHQLVYFGHAMSLQQPVCTIYPAREGEPELWNVYGSLCTTNDALAKQILLAGVREGDKLVFCKTGAYCMTEGISLFLSRDLPRVLMAASDGSIRMVRDRMETYTLNTPGKP